jgi:membrane-bound ClpP family serine protease
MKNARLILAIFSSLLDEALIIGLLLWGLPQFGVNIPLPIVITVVVLFAVFSIFSFKLGSRILQKKPLPGLPDLTGVEGKVVQTLDPKGTVKIEGELWTAKSLEGRIEIGTEIVVVTQKNLRLEVKKKQQPFPS